MNLDTVQNPARQYFTSTRRKSVSNDANNDACSEVIHMQLDIANAESLAQKAIDNHITPNQRERIYGDILHFVLILFLTVNRTEYFQRKLYKHKCCQHPQYRDNARRVVKSRLATLQPGTRTYALSPPLLYSQSSSARLYSLSMLTIGNSSLSVVRNSLDLATVGSLNRRPPERMCLVSSPPSHCNSAPIPRSRSSDST
ncbi:hypothetical protein J6590_023156 [Homalodisca vitripennis]|nr:hypothetical protein J6590_023156 [Homalodisca vitripennis]